MRQPSGLRHVFAAPHAWNIQDRLQDAGAALAPLLQRVACQKIADDDKPVAIEDPRRALDFVGLDDLEAAQSVVPAQMLAQPLDAGIVGRPAPGCARIDLAAVRVGKVRPPLVVGRFVGRRRRAPADIGLAETLSPSRALIARPVRFLPRVHFGTYRTL